ncbi:MAG: acyltransferase family protein [Candidatus Nanopelagicales bacterium]|nr:acyltransferase family protein [Candidatus Nanopelagicales bacterium]
MQGHHPAHRPRIEWMDLVKGTTVLIVVLFHCIVHLHAATPDGDVSSAWHSAMLVLEPMRMPLFFLVSGMLAAGAINRPWRLSRRRTFGMAYLYVLWSAIFFASAAAIFATPWREALLKFPSELLLGSSGYWYLYALLLYFIVAKAVRRWPVWVVLALAVAPNLLRPMVAQWNRDFLIDIDAGSMATSIVTNLVFFLLGAYCKELLTRIADRASWRWVAGILVVVVAFGVWRSTQPDLWEQTFLPISLAWIVAGVMAASLLVQHSGPRRFGTYFGARTLPIFVVQFPLLLVMSTVLRRGDFAFLELAWVQLIAPLVLGSLLVMIALVVHRLTLGNAGRFLFEAPHWVVGERPAPPAPLDAPHLPVGAGTSAAER